MAIALGKYLVYGELFNTRRNSVHGWLGLIGLECAMHLELTGNCEPDLAGKHIRFKVRRIPSVDFDERAVAHFQVRQIGPTGKMTAALKVRVDASGEPLPPAVDDDGAGQWQECLYLEWFGQNGRIIVELVDPVIQIVGPAEKDRADEFFGDIMPDRPEPASGFDPLAAPAESDASVGDDPSAAPWTSIPGDLQRELDMKTAAVDRALTGDDDVRQTILEMELMDDLIDHGVGVPLESIMDATGPLPAPETLTENQAQCVLKVLLARLALQGIAVDMCEHFTALDTYRLLRNELGLEGQCYRELKGTGWVQHYSTFEFCKVCEAEFDREWEDSRKRDKPTE